MPTTLTPDSVHTPVGNRAAAAPRRFQSVDPTLGADNKRHALDPGGFESFAGFSLHRLVPAAPGRPRAITELTFGAPKAGLLAPAIVGPPPQEVTDTTVYPFRANASLRIQVPGKTDTFIGSGWFVGPYAVITAGHALYIREPGGYTGWASQIEVIPGQNGEGNKPFGSSVSGTFQSTNAWVQSGDDTQDYGVILLSDGLGLKVGTYGYSTYADADILSAVANLSGYPATPPAAGKPQGEQWYNAGSVTQVDSSFVFYQLGALGGDSGAAVYRNLGANSYVMAIHTGSNTDQNRGVRITDAVFDNIQQWAQMRA